MLKDCEGAGAVLLYHAGLRQGQLTQDVTSIQRRDVLNSVIQLRNRVQAERQALLQRLHKHADVWIAHTDAACLQLVQCGAHRARAEPTSVD